MKIAFFGSSLVSSYWNGAATYYRGLLKALARARARDHVLRAGRFRAAAASRHCRSRLGARRRLSRRPTMAGRRPLEDARAMPTCWSRRAASACSTRELEDARAASRAAADALASTGTSMRPLRSTHRAPIRASSARGDSALRYRASPMAAAIRSYAPIEGVGARDCVPIYNALDPATHFPVPAAIRDFACDLGFLGNRLPDRETRVEEFFLEPRALRRTAVSCSAASGWDDKPCRRTSGTSAMSAPALTTLSSAPALATLNINRDSMARYGFSPPTRVFEAAGAGACLITDAWEGIELFLEPGEESWSPRDGDGRRRAPRALTPARARDDRRAPRARRILAEHTYAHRARQVDDGCWKGSRCASEAAE